VIYLRDSVVEQGIPDIVDSTHWILLKITATVAVALSIGPAGITVGQCSLVAHQGDSQ
jgi:hypothetical protein